MLPARNRAQHGGALLEQAHAAEEAYGELQRRRAERDLEDQEGLLLTFVSDPLFELNLDALEDRRAGIELLAVRRVDNRTEATVLVPPGKLTVFSRKLVAYLEEETRTGNPAHQKLVDSIASFRVAALEQLWTDIGEPIPSAGSKAWWEVWLRGVDQEKPFRLHSSKLDIHVKHGVLPLLDRAVVLVRATREQMMASVELLDCVAELRLAKANPEEFLDLSPAEQAEWAKDLVDRVTWPDEEAPAVCLLDTGVNREHPVLAPALAAGDVLTCNPNWGSSDSHPHGHGTAMAGIALFGDDLAGLLASNTALTLGHRLESVKLLPPKKQNEPELFGYLTQEAIGRAEENAPGRTRSICSTVTYPEGRDRGQPTSWSTAIDAAIAGIDDDNRRLVVQSVGNVPIDRWPTYPDCCHIEAIHDPAQAWNALAVGAITTRCGLDTKQYPGWTLVAPSGALSPCSTTSLAWDHQTPTKPDLVLEGGNAAIDPANKLAWDVESLRLLSTHHKPLERLLTVTGDTSAATAQCSRMAAIIQAKYPALWPETVRALLVHSADWTQEMLRQLPPDSSQNRRKLLCCYGFGIPSLERALWSGANRLTLIVEDRLSPFRLEKSEVKTNEMKLHPLPWPKEVLLGLGDLEVELRVTLSYFVEPNPGRRGRSPRHRYASHGLRFALLRTAETVDAFRKRLNKAARDEDEDRTVWASESETGWVIGPRQRFRGSLHSDRWRGTAAELATRNSVGIVPVSGWWRSRKALRRWDRPARYALIVSIHTPAETMDVYTPVIAQIPVPIAT